MRITFLLPFVLTALPVTAMADEHSVTAPATFDAEMSFEDASFAVENAIIGAGLVIDSESHVGDMLARTKEDVGGSVDLFAGATVFNFCSADVSRKVMEADPMNLQFCPYGIFVAQAADSDTVTVGHQIYPAGMEPVNDMLDAIIKDALMIE